MTRPTVFISYSHKDENEKDVLLSHLGVLQHANLVELWSDDQIGAGTDWQVEINRSITQAKVAILFISANFLTSNFILNTEVPTLLQRQECEGLLIFPVIAKACAWRNVDWLAKMNIRPRNGRPIWSDRGSHVDEDLAAIAEEVADIIKKANSKRAHLFICYKRSIERDRKLAKYLDEFLATQGHDVFIDSNLTTGEAWLEEIDRQIKISDFLVVLLSRESIDSEMVQAEVRRAYEYRKLQGRPHTLPVRVAYDGLLPYSIDAFLAPLQHAVWHSDLDNEQLGYDILAIIEGRLPEQPSIQAQPVATDEVIVSEDGHIITTDEPLHSPLPEFDPRFLEELPTPGGAVKLRDKFYIEREADADLRWEIVKLGTTTAIRAPRQTGKSSLLVRGMHYARQKGAKGVRLDLQRIDSEYLETADVFLHYLAEFIVRKLQLNLAKLEDSWRGSLGSQDKLTYLLESYILPEVDATIILALDEVDRLLFTPFHSDFFALVRSWHNNRAFDELWDKLNIVMVISTEPHLLIPDVSQSPFNVGLELYLEDFNAAQVEELNRRYGTPVKEADFPRLMALLSGHPYLTRKALYTLVTKRLTWTELTQMAATDEGPFGDHLRHHHWLLRNERNLQEALKQVVHHGRCSDETVLFRLLRAGLVKGRGEVYTCRCGLYRDYFKDKLR